MCRRKPYLHNSRFGILYYLLHWNKFQIVFNLPNLDFPYCIYYTQQQHLVTSAHAWKHKTQACVILHKNIDDSDRAHLCFIITTASFICQNYTFLLVLIGASPNDEEIFDTVCNSSVFCCSVKIRKLWIKERRDLGTTSLPKQ